MVGSNILEHPSIGNWNVIAPSSNELDLRNADHVYSYIKSHRPETIVHAAGLVGGIHANIKDPINFLDVNMIIGRNLISSAHSLSVPNLINISSTCMYPRAAKNPLQEDMLLTGALEPTNEGYALAKLITTRLCQYIDKDYDNLHYKSLIACNLYGRYDKFESDKSHLLAAIIRKIHFAKSVGSESVDIWGDGSARREFMYAGDFADAVLRAALEIEALPDIMNISMGYDLSINDHYQAVADALEWHGHFHHDLSKPVGMSQKLACIRRRSKWGWRPRTCLREGVRGAYKYFLEYCSED